MTFLLRAQGFAAGAFLLALAAAGSALNGTVADSLFLWMQTVAILALGIALWRVMHRGTIARAHIASEFAALLKERESVRLQIARLNSAQGRFVGNIAHEIKTPLATAMVHAELLRACKQDPAAVVNHANSIACDILHLSGLIDSFLRLARLHAQEDRSHHLPVSLNDVVVEAVRRSGSAAAESQVSIRVTLQLDEVSDECVEVLGDDVLLETMLENLIRNAVRFSPKGTRVGVAVEPSGDAVAIRVSDCGPGIAPEFLESTFDWFFDAPESRSPVGLGFGLAIARRVAEHHGGTLSLANRPEGGCEFQARIPRHHAAA